MSYDLSGRVAIVTGGGTGIGAATARLLAEHGADLVIASRTGRRARARRGVDPRRHRTTLPGGPHRREAGDRIVRMVERTIDEFGQIDILVNNAGGTRMGPLEELPDPRLGQRSSGSTCARPFLCTREVGRHCRTRIGRDRQRVVGRRAQRREGRRALRRGKVGAADVHDASRPPSGDPTGSAATAWRSGWWLPSARSTAWEWRSSTTAAPRPRPAGPRRASRTRWPDRSSSSPATRRPTSAARPSRSTGAVDGRDRRHLIGEAHSRGSSTSAVPSARRVPRWLVMRTSTRATRTSRSS